MKQPHRHGPLAYGIELWIIRIRDKLRPPRRILSAQSDLRDGMTVLDFGCGPSGFSVAAARIVGPQGRVHAYDVRSQALDAVRQAAAHARVDNIALVNEAGLQKIPMESVDMALLYDVLHGYLEPDWTKSVLTGICRVLKPEGRLSVRDHHLDDARLSAGIAGSRLFRLAEKQGDTLLFIKTGVESEQ